MFFALLYFLRKCQVWYLLWQSLHANRRLPYGRLHLYSWSGLMQLGWPRQGGHDCPERTVQSRVFKIKSLQLKTENTEDSLQQRWTANSFKDWQHHQITVLAVQYNLCLLFTDKSQDKNYVLGQIDFRNWQERKKLHWRLQLMPVGTLVSLNRELLPYKSRGTNTILNNELNLEQIHKEKVITVCNTHTLN